MHPRSRTLAVAATALLAWAAFGQEPAQDPQRPAAAAEQEAPPTVEDRVRAFYEAVGFEPGGECDWEALEDLMHPTAQLAMPELRESPYPRAEFFEDFRRFVAESRERSRGFQERVASVQIREHGRIAQALVVFEIRFDRTSTKPYQRGVDMLQLVRVDEKWQILSIVAEGEREALPIPADFLKQR